MIADSSTSLGCHSISTRVYLNHLITMSRSQRYGNEIKFTSLQEFKQRFWRLLIIFCTCVVTLFIPRSINRCAGCVTPGFSLTDIGLNWDLLMDCAHQSHLILPLSVTLGYLTAQFESTDSRELFRSSVRGGFKKQRY